MLLGFENGLAVKLFVGHGFTSHTGFCLTG
jgi:hypothetical protein